MMIETEYKGATEYKSSRILVRAAGERITVTWDHNLDVEANHDAAARTMAVKLEWAGQWTRGSTKKGFVYVCSEVAFTTL